MSRRKVGFFGGTFDPIQLGHLNLSISILEKHNLEAILFCPANYSPEKEAYLPMASNQERKQMVEIAIAPIAQFSLLTWELEREGPSYTIETIRQLQKEHPDTDYALILGEDVLAGLPKWQEIEELLKLAPPIVGTRPHEALPKLPPPIKEIIEGAKSTIPAMDISSTTVRERLLQKRPCDHLVPAKVLDYIHEKQLYL